jgi:type II secretory pathway pseudopilin PulG
MKRVLLIVASMAAVVLGVGAATPSEVVPDLVASGYAIEDGADATDAVVGRAVSDARAFGSLFYAVVLVDEPSAGATTFADGVLDDVPRSEGTVLVVGPETVGWASNADIWSAEELNRALDASLEGSTSDDVVTLFVDDLVSGGGAGSSSGNGPWILLLIIGAVVALIVFAVWRGSRNRRRAREKALADLKRTAQAQIDAIANDILDDEAEVAESTNDEVKRHFDAAGVIYRDAADRVERATTIQEMAGIASDLEAAVWHLDCAEALIDGTEPPPRPEPPKPAPPATTGGPTSAPTGAPSSGVPPLPTYERRPTRRSGPGADDMLKAVLAMQAMRSLGGGFRGGSSGRRSSGGRAPRSSPSSGRTRGGGRRRG